MAIIAMAATEDHAELSTHGGLQQDEEIMHIDTDRTSSSDLGQADHTFETAITNTELVFRTMVDSEDHASDLIGEEGSSATTSTISGEPESDLWNTRSSWGHGSHWRAFNDEHWDVVPERMVSLASGGIAPDGHDRLAETPPWTIKMRNTTFTCFGAIPIDLRLKVWRYALPKSRVLYYGACCGILPSRPRSTSHSNNMRTSDIFHSCVTRKIIDHLHSFMYERPHS
ncbi:uncharacterized protein PAC_05451 [Phialocephala subalpina]|uniref:2EXR domain-containing protein n=1 Tax=Phialocephala subalpina TaxID=576137 RepID=A0A1L7WS26_9HELO|nr:uncharacterized protein PAC_05451 [Phialocephala subalpina]